MALTPLQIEDVVRRALAELHKHERRLVVCDSPEEAAVVYEALLKVDENHRFLDSFRPAIQKILDGPAYGTVEIVILGDRVLDGDAERVIVAVHRQL